VQWRACRFLRSQVYENQRFVLLCYIIQLVKEI
jgi:hypothetical protein